MPARSLHVLHVSQPVDGGVGRCVHDLVRDQVARGWRVSVACPTEGALARATLAEGAHHVPWPAKRSLGPVPVETVRLRRVLAQVQPDLVHLHSSKAGLSGRLVIRGRSPTIFQPHAWSFLALTGIPQAVARAWERRAAHLADVIVCVSERERQSGEQAGVQAAWRVIRNGVDTGTHTRASPEERRRARRELALDDAPLAVCIGRLSRQKGQDILLDAWPLVIKRVPRAQLVLVGDGPEKEHLEGQATQGVSLVGHHDDVRDWLIAADVVALPSRWEGLPLTMLEAMASGRSVVATDVSGAHEVLGGIAGAVVPTEAPIALADALVSRLLDSEKAATEGREGRARIESSHDLKQALQAMVEVYDLVLSGSISSSSKSR